VSPQFSSLGTLLYKMGGVKFQPLFFSIVASSNGHYNYFQGLRKLLLPLPFSTSSLKSTKLVNEWHYYCIETNPCSDDQKRFLT